jgi:tetratricopeptide (TPR) repeat protein
MGAAGYIAYLTFWGGSSPARLARAAEQAYQRGQAAEADKNWDLAQQRYDEARLLAQKGLEALQKLAETQKISESDYKTLLGQLNWIKARAIRDFYYAQAAAQDKPLQDFSDPLVQENFRPFPMIPDNDDRAEAIAAVRIASSILKSEDPEVLKEGIRLEITLNPILWKQTEPLLREALKRNPSDPRAHYFLARYEFDQPLEDGVTPTDDRRKSGERVQLAREHLEQAKKKSVHYWRTVGLEAEILDWTLRTAEARRLKPETQAATRRQLEELLFAEPAGAIPLAQSGQKYEHFGNADGQGLLRLLRIAMSHALEEARRPMGDSRRVSEVAQAALKVTQKMQSDANLRPFFPNALAVLAELATSAQPILSRTDPTTWKQLSTSLEQMLTQAPPGTVSPPQARRQLAQLRVNEAVVALRNQDMARFRELLHQAQKLLEEGLRDAESAKLPDTQLDEFHYDLADLKLKAGAKRDEIVVHLNRLQASNLPPLKQRGQFLEAVLTEREGKLERARQILEPIASLKTDTQLALRAKMLLANLNLALNEPLAAVAYLREIEPVFQTLDDLPALDRAWLEELTGGRDMVLAALVQANLAAALQAAQKYQRDNPKQPVPASLIEGYLQAALEYQKKLRPPSFADRTARLLLAEFYLRSNQREQTEKLISTLSADYPDSVEVLRTRCRLLALPKEPSSSALDPNGVAAADTLIRRFLKDYPNDRVAKLFYAEWLLQTQRTERAIEYLKDPTHFPPTDPLAQRLLGLAYLRAGQREQAQKILSTLPNDPNLDLLLIQTAATREAGEKQLQEAMKRYENQGRFRLYEAMLRLQEGKFPDAIRGFASAVEFSEVRSAARQGMLLTFIAYLQVQPDKARDLALQYVNELKDFPSLYLVVADAALLTEDVGEPADRWEARKTMYAALNKWEEVALQQGTPRADILLTKARAHLLAGYPERARREALNSLAQNPTHGPTLMFLTELSLLPPADLTRAQEYLAAAQKQAPNDPRLPYIQARVAEASGNPSAAIAVYRKLIEERPDDPLPRSLLVKTLEDAGQREQALTEARQWLSRLPDDITALTTLVRLLVLQKVKQEALTAAEDFLKRQLDSLQKRLEGQQPPLSAQERDQRLQAVRTTILLATASAFHKAQDFEEALRRAREVLSSDPNHLGALLLVGEIAVARQQWDEAISIYNAILKVRPRHFVAGNNLAWILAEKLQQPVQALAIVQDIWKGRPDLPPVAPERLPADFLDTVGVIYSKLQRSDLYPEMRSIFEAAIRRYPTDPRMYLYLAHAQAALGERSKAIENYDTAIRLASNNCPLPPDQAKAVLQVATQARQKLQN